MLRGRGEERAREVRREWVGRRVRRVRGVIVGLKEIVRNCEFVIWTTVRGRELKLGLLGGKEGEGLRIGIG